jgi:hypothetical protein
MSIPTSLPNQEVNIMKLFTKNTPATRGRIKVTVEFDAVAQREIVTNFKDAIKWLTTSPERKEIVAGFIETMQAIGDS